MSSESITQKPPPHFCPEAVSLPFSSGAALPASWVSEAAAPPAIPQPPLGARPLPPPRPQDQAQGASGPEGKWVRASQQPTGRELQSRSPGAAPGILSPGALEASLVPPAGWRWGPGGGAGARGALLGGGGFCPPAGVTEATRQGQPHVLHLSHWVGTREDPEKEGSPVQSQRH